MHDELFPAWSSYSSQGRTESWVLLTHLTGNETVLKSVLRNT